MYNTQQTIRNCNLCLASLGFHMERFVSAGAAIYTIQRHESNHHSGFNVLPIIRYSLYGPSGCGKESAGATTTHSCSATFSNTISVVLDEIGGTMTRDCKLRHDWIQSHPNRIAELRSCTTRKDHNHMSYFSRWILMDRCSRLVAWRRSGIRKNGHTCKSRIKHPGITTRIKQTHGCTIR